MIRHRRRPRRAIRLAAATVATVASWPDVLLGEEEAQALGERYAERLKQEAWRRGIPITDVLEELDRMAEEVGR